ncbi:MAG: hypothetical protein RI568_12595 [Natronomonas sp.]|uniref:hypothetical protein n=1 Tax=Natronomonas sp. TaxID=2184060 RepID=UPI002870AC89|nr:hypothetical protein [Natronomonas sp.]MDR9431521.1 hypothetical protein [Natronomonas sp.]
MSGEYQYVANYDCENCGHTRTMKMRNKVGSFTDECPTCGAETEFGLAMDPLPIDRFGDEVIG